MCKCVCVCLYVCVCVCVVMDVKFRECVTCSIRFIMEGVYSTLFSCMSIVSLSMCIIGKKNHQNCQNETPPQLPVIQYTNSVFPTASTQIMIIILDIYINNN